MNSVVSITINYIDSMSVLHDRGRYADNKGGHDVIDNIRRLCHLYVIRFNESTKEVNTIK